MNIDQFVERASEKPEVCPRCAGAMRHTSISVWDAVCVLFTRKKITGRLRCSDCRLEIRATEANE